MWLDWQECDGVMIKDDDDKLDEIQVAKHFKFQPTKKLHGRWTWDKDQRFMIYEVTPEKGTEKGEIMMNY